MKNAIGVDLGGTKIAAAVVDEAGRVLAHNRIPTPALSGDAVVDGIVSLVKELQELHSADAICVGVPGFVDATRSRLLFSPNLPFNDEPLRTKLETKIGSPVVIENDANAAAWGEFRFGAARNKNNVVMLTVGTGLGGGIVIDNRLVRGAHGFAGEIGHMILIPDGQPCGCGLAGCFEQYSSGNALLRMSRDLAAARRSEASKLLSLGDGTPEGIQGAHITEAARAGCPVAQAGFAELGRYLGRGMAMVAALVDPDTFVIGGGVSEAGDLFLDSVRTSFEDHITAKSHRPLPSIVIATLGNDAGMIGAADLARYA